MFKTKKNDVVALRALAVGATILGGTAVACIGEIVLSVHFNSLADDFFEPPASVIARTWDNRQSRYAPEADDSNWQIFEQSRRRLAQLRGQLQKTKASKERLRLLRLIIAERPDDINRFQDRLEIETQIVKAPLVKTETYFKATASGDATKLASIFRDPGAGFLRAHALFQLGGLNYDKGNFELALIRFKEVSDRFVNSPRREGALIMQARLGLRLRENADGKVLPTPTNESMIGKKALQTLTQSYPKSRFSWDALGWQGRIEFLQANFPEALAIYLRQLDSAATYERKMNALSSLRTTFNRIKAKDGQRVRKMLFERSELLEPYLTYRLYVRDVDKDYNVVRPDYSGLARLANEVLETKPKTAVSAQLLARLAEIAYLQGDFPRAQTLSERALKTDSTLKGRADLATYVQGSSLARQGKTEEAKSSYEQLLKAFPKSYLANATKESVALLYERTDDWSRAYRSYQDINYDLDKAYLLDVRIPLEAFPAFIDNLGNEKEKMVATYAYGLRLLRKDRFADSARVLSRLPEKTRLAFAGIGKERDMFVSTEKGIDVLNDPLKIANDLQALRSAYDSASDETAKAEALYTYGSYFYLNRNLALYNYNQWQGGRSFLLGAFWNNSAAVRDDRLARDQHYQEHECANKTRVVLLEVAARYPKSEAASKALYRAACAAIRLANFDPYWRSLNAEYNMYDAASKLMARVHKEYPASPLAANAKKYEKVFLEAGKSDQTANLFRPVNEKFVR